MIYFIKDTEKTREGDSNFVSVVVFIRTGVEPFSVVSCQYLDKAAKISRCIFRFFM